MQRLPFYSDCVGWPRDKLPTLIHLVDEGEEITRATFFRYIDKATIPAEWYPHRRYWGHNFYRMPRFNIYWYTHFGDRVRVRSPGDYRRARAGAR